MYWRAFGRFKEPPREAPQITEKRMQLIDLMARATSIETDDRFFETTWAMCVETHFYDGCKTEHECMVAMCNGRSRWD